MSKKYGGNGEKSGLGSPLGKDIWEVHIVRG